MFGFRKRRRKRLSQIPLPQTSWEIIDRRVPYIRSLSEHDRRELGGIIQILLHEKRFEGCGGLEMTDEIRLTIAAQAAVLLLHRTSDYYPTLKTILVYPDAYVVPDDDPGPDGTISVEPEVRLGESWHRGALVLSWDDVKHGAANADDGHNLVFHEFAHQLDSESGAMNGAPRLPTSAMYAQWAHVLSAEYEQLIRRVHAGHKSLLDPYGSTDPAEFFAVATELFFERPNAMKKQHPDLYAQLAKFYEQDPAAE